jgi:hypothetical protein
MCARGSSGILLAMSTTKRWLVAIGSLVGALAFAAGAVGEHSVLELVSTGPTASFDGASEDGTRVFFQTADTLLSADTDSSVDVYQRAGGETTLLFARPGRQRRAARARRR